MQPAEFPPVRYRGRIWVRVGPRKSIASEAEEKVLTERRLSNVRTFDAKPCLGTSLQDLDISLIKKEFLSKAVAEDILAEDKRSIEEQLASLGFFDLRYNCPTIGALSFLEITRKDSCMVLISNTYDSKEKTEQAISSMNSNLMGIYVNPCPR